VFDLPLFPLNTVLFPGAPLNLHIFEPRYREMIGLCLREKLSFGVTLIRRGQEALGPLAQPFLVGCSAHILQVEKLADGRMNIATVGVERFRILSLDSTGEYLRGQVERLPIDQSDEGALAVDGRQLRRLVVLYLSQISEQLPETVEAKFLPVKPLALAYVAAYLVQAPPVEKQALLEAGSTRELLDRLLSLYRRELAILPRLRREENITERGFTLN
jgi:Lon protease-like protein